MNTGKPKPYISFVVASRNDNHGRDMDKRQRIFLRGLIHQANKYKLPIELLFVEWNPPADRPPLHEAMPKPDTGDYLTLKYVVVPEQIHQRYRFAKAMPLYQMIAKNVGIRRASADFILCTNVDLLFSDKLMELLAAKNLDSQHFYRANRCDIPAEIDESLPTGQQLEYAAKHIIRRLGKDPEHLHLHGWPSWIYKYRLVSKNANRLAEIKRRKFYDPAELQITNLDTNACGDFTLMHRSVWEDIQGYPELDLYSIHIDSMGIIAASALGYKQYIFPSEACTYHIDHENGWEALNATQRIAFLHQRPGIGWEMVFDAAKQLIKEKGRFNLNNPDWGFANEKFDEVVFNSFE